MTKDGEVTKSQRNQGFFFPFLISATDQWDPIQRKI